MVAPGRPYQDLSYMTISGNELVMLRADDVTSGQAQALEAELRKAFPDWSGPFLVMSTTQAIERLPESAARLLHAVLHEKFGNETNEEQTNA